MLEDDYCLFLTSSKNNDSASQTIFNLNRLSIFNTGGLPHAAVCDIINKLVLIVGLAAFVS